MSETLTIELHNRVQARAALTEQVFPYLSQALQAGRRCVMSVKPQKRNLAQNARLWAMLTDVSRQVEWYGKRLTQEDWKHVFTASLRKLSVVPNLDGTGFVALGLSTSNMTKAEFSELIELIFAFGAERGVKWSDPQESGQ